MYCSLSLSNALNFSYGPFASFSHSHPRTLVFSGEGRGVTSPPPPPPKGHSAMSGDIVVCHSWGVGITGIYRVEARDVAKHLTVHRTAPHSNDPSPMSQ